MSDLLRRQLPETNSSIKLCIVIGDPISHSRSPSLHNAAYAACGLSQRFLYAACHIRAADLKEAIGSVRELGIRGVSVTIPHKQAVLALLDEIDPLAAKVGAVNTIVNNDGKLRGYNTDLAGIILPLEAQTSLSGKRVALLGAGGAARAAAFAVTTKGASLTIFNRTIDEAQSLAAEVKATAADLSDLAQLSGFDIILQSTPVGMSPDVERSLIPEQYLHAGQIVFDFVYNPPETKLLRQAKQRGAVVISGIEMFLQQGAAQFELYTGQKAPLEAMRQALMINSSPP